MIVANDGTTLELRCSIRHTHIDVPTELSIGEAETFRLPRKAYKCLSVKRYCCLTYQQQGEAAVRGDVVIALAACHRSAQT